MRTTKYNVQNHEWNHEWTEPRKTRKTRKKSRGLLNHEWTRMDTNKTREPLMDTNGHE